MNWKTTIGAAAAAIFALVGCSEPAPEPFGPCPSPRQVDWQKMEMNMFCHFGPNTFTGLEWGEGTEPEDVFAPSGLDCRQWASIARRAGFGGIIITAKHHDGFCLWPNPESAHTVAQGSWKGDVLDSLSRACAAEGIGMGIYISPWDRNDPRYGTPAYNEAFLRTLESALGSYGPIFEQWFDGACGEGPTGKRQVYDWPAFNAKVADLQPGAVVFSDVGPGCRWVGNESGRAGSTNWSTLVTDGFTPGAGAPPVDTLSSGNRARGSWIPAEADVSIRPGWFFRESETPHLKSLTELLDIYYTSVGRGAVLLLNVPPDTRGLIHPADSARLMELRAALDDIFALDLASGGSVTASPLPDALTPTPQRPATAVFEAEAAREPATAVFEAATAKEPATATRKGKAFRAANVLDGDFDTYWAAPDGVTTACLTIDLPGPRSFNRVMLQEYIPLGQRIASFEVEVLGLDGDWHTLECGTTVGYKRILLVPETTATALRIRITSALASPTLSRISLFQDNYLP